MSAAIDCRTLLDRVRESKLVAADDLERAAGLGVAPDRGRQLARALVERGVLTRFQAEMILAGRTEGFHLGQYVVLEPLGKGGMGRVFKARHRTMIREVALKVLAPGLTSTERARQLFLREVRAAARLHHPNIVTAFDAGEAGGRCYLAMELVDGPNLQELVKGRGPLPVGRACDFVVQAALGLQHAFEQGMAHRDVKPSNLLVGRGSAVKILDFGLARLSEPPEGEAAGSESILTAPGAVMGTPDYLSPEQARCVHAADIRSDLYGLGGTLYFLLTGQVPFPGGSAVEKMVRHATEEPAPVEDLRPDVPEPVAAVVRRLLAKNPADRFQTPEELAVALAAHCGDEAPWWQPPPAPATRTPGPRTESPFADAADDEESVLAALPLDGRGTPAPGRTTVTMIRIPRLPTPAPAEAPDPPPPWGWVAAALVGWAGLLAVAAWAGVKYWLAR